MDRDTEKIARANAKLDKEFAEAMAELERFQPFQIYKALLAKKIQTCGDELMLPLKDFDAALLQEHVKGTMNGLILARDLPSVTIAAMKDSSAPQTED